MKEGGRRGQGLMFPRGIPCSTTTTLPHYLNVCLPPCMRHPFMANPACVLSARRIPHMTSVFPAR